MTDREKLIGLLKNIFGGQFFSSLIGEFADYLLAHGVTVQKHGRWEFDKVEMESFCSECGEAAPVGMSSYILHKYCPNCGAKMEE